jgi:hypothetical protein
MNIDWKEPAYQRPLLLNMPPHHINKWTETSLKYLPKIFPLKLDMFLYEPLFNHRIALNKKIIEHRYSLFKYLPERIKQWFFTYCRPLKIGDTIIAIYTKK